MAPAVVIGAAGEKTHFHAFLRHFFVFLPSFEEGTFPSPLVTPLVGIDAQGDPTKISYYRRGVGRVGKIFLLTYYPIFQ